MSNAAPVADAGGPYTLAEGDSVQLDGSASSDPGGDIVAYDWDFDYDGVTFDIDGIGVSPTIAGFDGPQTLNIALRATDTSGEFDISTASVTVNNVAPMANLFGPSVGVTYQPLSYVGSFVDPGPVDVHTASWQVTDSSGGVIASDSGLELEFVPVYADDYTVSFTVADDDGGVDTVSIVVTVGAIQVLPDPIDPSRAVLFVGGTSGDDKITIKRPNSDPSVIRVRFDGVTVGDFGPNIDRIVVYSGAGDDVVKVSRSVGVVDAELYGGEGNDKLRGGLGNDVLVGGSGDDLLAGKGGRDLLIGGLGADKVVGNDDDDILIGGIYLEQTNREALDQIMKTWTRADLDYVTRVDHLSNGSSQNTYLINDTTVYDDGVKDKLRGKQGLDWFLGNLDDDKTDVDDLEEILTLIEVEFIEDDGDDDDGNTD